MPKARAARKVLSAALTNAMREEHIGRNVAQLTRLAEHTASEVQPWTVEEARRFLVAAEGDPLYLTFVLLLLCGLRRGEALGIRWSDVDFKKGVIHVRQQLVRASGRLQVGPLKTRASRRDLPLLGAVDQVLKRRLGEQGAARRQAGSDWRGVDTSEQLVTSTRSGLPVEPRNLARSFQRICKHNGLRIIRLHDLRHTTATLLMSFGAADKDIQEILGHSRIATTRQVYEHSSMERRSDALSRVVERLLVGDDSVRCRQSLPSMLKSVVTSTTSISGGAMGARTPDLLHAMQAL